MNYWNRPTPTDGKAVYYCETHERFGPKPKPGQAWRCTDKWYLLPFACRLTEGIMVPKPKLKLKWR